jgi:20S proteasome alpha/beta subunit
VTGKGKEIANPHLQEAYSPDMTLDRVTVLAAESMNLALADKNNYTGYTLVRARKVRGLNTVETVVDVNAQVMPTEFKEFTDYRFRRK